MVLSSTHTHANLEVTLTTYDEIANKLREAGYDHVFDEDGVIDMHGIGLVCGGATLPPVVRQEVVKIQPGDTLVLRSLHPLTEAHVARFKEQFERVFRGNKCVMLDSGMEMSVMRETKLSPTNPDEV